MEAHIAQPQAGLTGDIGTLGQCKYWLSGQRFVSDWWVGNCGWGS
jgi:hypothetical protein